jgi:hypothetical protein
VTIAEKKGLSPRLHFLHMSIVYPTVEYLIRMVPSAS